MIAPARRQPRPRELERAQLVVGIALRERQLILQSAQDEIVARHLGDDADTGILQCSGGGAHIAAGRLDIAPALGRTDRAPIARRTPPGRYRSRGDSHQCPAIPAANPDCACSCPRMWRSDTRSKPASRCAARAACRLAAAMLKSLLWTSASSIKPFKMGSSNPVQYALHRIGCHESGFAGVRETAHPPVYWADDS